MPKEKAGTVVGQSEEAGTQVETGSSVGLTVASGSVSLPVEKIIGSSYQEAKGDAGGPRPHRRSACPSSRPSSPGTVLDIGESTSRVDVGSTVTLVVAVAKPKPTPTFTPTPTPKPTPKPTNAEADTDEDDAASGPGPGRRCGPTDADSARRMPVVQRTSARGIDAAVGCWPEMISEISSPRTPTTMKMRPAV